MWKFWKVYYKDKYDSIQHWRVFADSEEMARRKFYEIFNDKDSNIIDIIL